LWASLNDPPAVWFFKDSYTGIAGREFSSLRPEGQIAYLLRGDAERGTGVFWRHCSAAVVATYLAGETGVDVFDERILPQGKRIIGARCRALRLPPTYLLEDTATNDDAVKHGNGGKRLRRMGLDLLFDEDCTVWFIETNVLRNNSGLKSPAGPGRGFKFDATQRLVEEEARLKEPLARAGWRVGGGDAPRDRVLEGVPDVFGDLSSLASLLIIAPGVRAALHGGHRSIVWPRGRLGLRPFSEGGVARGGSSLGHRGRLARLDPGGGRRGAAGAAVRVHDVGGVLHSEWARSRGALLRGPV